MKLETLYENKLFLLASSWKVSRGLSQTPSGWNRALESAQQREAMCVSGGAAPRQSSWLVLVEVPGPPCLRTGSPEPDLLKDSSLLSCPLAAAGDQKAQVSRSSGRQGSWVSRRHKSGGAVEPRNPRVSRSHGPAGATRQPEGVGSGCGGGAGWAAAARRTGRGQRQTTRRLMPPPPGWRERIEVGLIRENDS